MASTPDPFDDPPRRKRSGATQPHPTPATTTAESPVAVATSSGKRGDVAPSSVLVSPAPSGTASPFATAPHQRSLGFVVPGELKHGFEHIVSDLFADGYDALAEWKAIGESLEIGGALTPDVIQQAANKSERTANRAFILLIVAKRECAAYMRETDAIVGAIRDAASAHLEGDRRKMVLDAKGKEVPFRTKQITEADVAAACAQFYGDEWENVNSRRESAELMVRQIENLATLAKSRAYTVSNMMTPGGRRVV